MSKNLGAKEIEQKRRDIDRWAEEIYYSPRYNGKSSFLHFLLDSRRRGGKRERDLGQMLDEKQSMKRLTHRRKSSVETAELLQVTSGLAGRNCKVCRSYRVKQRKKSRE